MPNYMLLLHDDPSQFAGKSGDEVMAVIQDYMAWTERMRAAGRYVGGEKLSDEPGRVLRRVDGAARVHDGPYSETREVLGGYMTISAASYDEACALVLDHPHLAYGGTIEVRAVEALD